MPTIAELLARRQLLAAESDSAALDTEILLAHSLGKQRSYLRAWPEAEVGTAQVETFESLMGRRQQGEPVAYLTGTRGFWTLDLKVSPASLIPRPETELLIEKVLELFPPDAAASILDLGTGSGAIALALATEFSSARVLGCDLEPAAVALAESNRVALGLENIRFFESDWFAQVPDQRFDCIVTNPPYIDPADPHLQRGDVRFEPASALVAGKAGLAAIEIIINHAPAFLNEGGYLLLEHGYDQGGAARNLMRAKGFEPVATSKDLAGHERVTFGFLKGADNADE